MPEARNIPGGNLQCCPGQVCAIDLQHLHGATMGGKDGSSFAKTRQHWTIHYHVMGTDVITPG